MKKVKAIVLLTLILIILNLSNVLAVGEQLYIEGDSDAKLAEKKSLTIKIVSEEQKIGAISGKIEQSSNLINIEKPIAKNGWNLTYNSDTGDFVMYNEEGVNTQEVMTINYTVSSNTGNEKITIKNVKFTTIEYEIIEIGDVTKDITIKANEENVVLNLSNIKISKAPNKTQYINGESFNTEGMIVTATYNNGSTKEISNYTVTNGTNLRIGQTAVTISYTENGVKKTVLQKISVINDESTKNENLPSTGIEDYKLVIILLPIAIIGIIGYTKYNKYRGV